MEEAIIRLVYEHQVLYDNTVLLYKDQNARTAAWADIGRQINLPAEDCNEIWGRLRKCYTNARKRHIKSMIKTNSKKFKKWKYEDHMSFLLPFLHEKNPSKKSHSPESEFKEDEDPAVWSENEMDCKPIGMVEERNEIKAPDEGKLQDDAVEQFFLSMASVVKKLPAVEQAKIRMEICNLVSSAEIKCLQKGF